MACLPTAIAAASGIETRPVKFARGESSATLNSTLKGDQTIDYVLNARAGQTMTIKLVASNGAHYFNVLPPGSNDVAIYNSSSGGNTWTGKLEASGDYRIRTYLMRSAARRNETSRYTLTVGIAGASGANVRPGDAKVPGTPYHATSQVPCASGGNAPGSAQCALGVIRGRPGYAEVHVTAPGGERRVLRFAGASMSMDSGPPVSATKRDGMWSVSIGDERYLIPEAVIDGG
jgi:hypothetical protein